MLCLLRSAHHLEVDIWFPNTWVFKVSLILISHLDVNLSFKCLLLCNHPLCFFSLVTLRLSMAKSKISLGKCYTALEHMCIFKYVLILISTIIAEWWENPVCMISVPLDYEIFASCFMSLDMFQYLLVYSLWELE